LLKKLRVVNTNKAWRHGAQQIRGALKRRDMAELEGKNNFIYALELVKFDGVVP
jgi:hypothetical protein